MIKTLTITTFFAFTTVTEASLKNGFNDLIKENNLSENKQSVCIKNGTRNALSYNADIRIIPASVSKLYTFDFALATLPEDFRYTTTFIQNKNTLYINGGGDPHFVTEHLSLVLKKIHAEKKVRINTIVFSPDFYFNWENTPGAVRVALTTALKATPTLPTAKTVKIISQSTPYTGVGTKYEFTSAPLTTLLKQINNHSTNISAEVLFIKLGGPAAFSAYMQKTYGVGSETIYFKNGSGLHGNYTTCALTLRVIKHLEKQLKEKDLSVTDVLSMPAVDPGVIKNRAINVNRKDAIVAKSGFLNYRHSLAGVINTKKSPIYFGIFTAYDFMAQTETVKSMVDDYTEEILTRYKKSLKSYDYTPDPTIFGDVLLKKL